MSARLILLYFKLPILAYAYILAMHCYLRSLDHILYLDTVWLYMFYYIELFL